MIDLKVVSKNQQWCVERKLLELANVQEKQMIMKRDECKSSNAV